MCGDVCCHDPAEENPGDQRREKGQGAKLRTTCQIEGPHSHIFKWSRNRQLDDVGAKPTLGLGTLVPYRVSTSRVQGKKEAAIHSSVILGCLRVVKTQSIGLEMCDHEELVPLL